MVLIALNVAVFLLVQSPLRGTDLVRVGEGTVPIDSTLRFDLEYAAIPCELTQGRPLTLNEIGATFVQGDTSACARHDDEARPCSLTRTCISPSSRRCSCTGAGCTFGFNMLFLWVFGNNVEDRLGSGRSTCFSTC